MSQQSKRQPFTTAMVVLMAAVALLVAALGAADSRPTQAHTTEQLAYTEGVRKNLGP